jgi:hypothetical protein
MSIITTAEEVTGQWWAIVPWYVYAIVLLVAGCAIQTIRLDHEEKNASTLQASVTAFEDTQKTNLATIAQLQLANKGWADAMNTEVANSKTYLDAANDYAQLQQAKAKKAQSTLESIYANHPESKAWSVVSVDISVASQLRANAGSR